MSVDLNEVLILNATDVLSVYIVIAGTGAACGKACKAKRSNRQRVYITFMALLFVSEEPLLKQFCLTEQMPKKLLRFAV